MRVLSFGKGRRERPCLERRRRIISESIHRRSSSTGRDARQHLSQPIIAGFTDDIGSASANLELARKRADAVRRELVALAPNAVPETYKRKDSGSSSRLPATTPSPVGKRTAASR
jgi:hypothetical protein